LYASFEKVNISDITVSFALYRHSRDVLKYLENERGLKVEEIEDGIYYVIGDIVKVQILEQKKLSSKTNLFLKVLGSSADLDDTIEILNIWEQGDFDRKSKFLETMIMANQAKFKEAVDMSATLERFFKEIVEDTGMTYQEVERLRNSIQ